jgi:hypothetical protein
MSEADSEIEPTDPGHDPGVDPPPDGDAVDRAEALDEPEAKELPDDPAEGGFPPPDTGAESQTSRN